MTKKKEQKSQKDTTPEVNEEVLKGSEELEDLKSQLEFIPTVSQRKLG
jgi:hypothetical protein